MLIIPKTVLCLISLVFHLIHRAYPAIQTTTVGLRCSQNTECGRGAYCNSNKLCQCLSTHTDINGYCWFKISPDSGGCTYNQQCNAVWPNAHCRTGVCRCSNEQPAFITRDGRICVTYGECPVNGKYTQYIDQTNGAIKHCEFGLDNSASDQYACWRTHECICTEIECGMIGVGGTGIGLCCPSRAFACIQPYDSGTPATGRVPTFLTRYYHNPIRGECETFRYHGTRGNANNFFTKDQCESYCKQSCERGPPQYLESNYDTSVNYPKKVVNFCDRNESPSTLCLGDNKYQCDIVGTRGTCCPTTAYVCSKNGGIAYNTAPLTIFDPGQNKGKTDKTIFHRWYYHPEKKYCDTFTYKGQAGNYNNFLTYDQCMAYCAKSICKAGLPLMSNDGVTNINCASATGCPAKYECQNGVCCPTKQTVCGQPKAVGNCGNFNMRWWFNAAKGSCQEFQYSGCHGNDNNFKSYTDCQSFCRGLGVIPKCIQGEPLQKSQVKYMVCGGDIDLQESCPANYYCYYDGNTYGCCPNKAYTCSQTYNSGLACGGPIVTRWYYKPDINQCESFPYKGCNGNSNNFATKIDCIEYCGEGGCPNGGEPYRKLNGQFHICGEFNTCPQNHECMAVSVARKAKRSLCCPTRTYVCRLLKNKGEMCARVPLSRFYFNTVTRNCEKFEYNGCGGNRNNFATKAQCSTFCNSADCPAGQIASIDMKINQLNACIPGETSCENSQFTCIQSDLLQTGICCGSDAETGSCPASQEAFIDPFTNQPLQCQPNINICPDNYHCWYSSALKSYFCCGSTSKALCPNGGNAWTNPITGHSMNCNPRVETSCSKAGMGYKCQARNIDIGGVLSVTGTCCGTPVVESVCGQGYKPYIFDGLTVRCHPRTANVCPSFAMCKSNPYQPNDYYCCMITNATGEVNVCGQGKVTLTLNNNPVACKSGAVPHNCPSPYSCILYEGTNTFYCCKNDITGSCPPGYKVFTVNDEVQRCSPNIVSPCAPGFFCQFDANERGYVCCGSRNRRLLSAISLRTTTIMTTELSPSTPTVLCPIGYTPLYNNGAMNTCDPKSLASCPAKHFCVWNYSRKTYVCCGPSQNTAEKTTMPSVSAPPMRCMGHSLTSRTCQVDMDCLAGFACEYSSRNLKCCMKIRTNDVYGCAHGNSILFPGTSLPLVCNPLTNRCPNGYICLPSLIYSAHQCCSA